MCKFFRIITILLITVGVSGCVINMPFNNRLAYSSIGEMRSVKIQGERPNLLIKWNPADFPRRIDTQGADGFVGGGSRSRIPTGIALSNRIEEAISTYADISNEGRVLTITVLDARSGFEYVTGFMNVTHTIDVGSVKFRASFELDGVTWTETFEAKIVDSAVGGTTQTGVLEDVWDDVAVQVAKNIALHLNQM